MMEPASEDVVGENIIRDETSWVSYSGIEEYLPTYSLVPLSKRDHHLNDCLSTTIDTSEWQTFAAFHVESQSRQVGGCSKHRLLVRNLNTGAIETCSSLETDVLQQWIVGQVREMLPPARVEISRVQIQQSVQAGKLTVIGDRALQPIRADQPFTVSFLIQFTELPTVHLSTSDEITESIGGHVQCRARNLSTGATISLYDARVDFRNVENGVAEAHASESSVAKNNTYQSQRFEVTLPESGVYRLFLNLIVPIQPNLSAAYKIPALRVI